MESASEKRKTQIDFKILKLNPPLKTAVHGDAIGNYAERKENNQSKVILKGNIGKAPTRESGESQEEKELESTTSLKSFKLPEVVRSGVKIQEYLKITTGSPWQTYEKSYDIRLGAEKFYVTVAERRDAQLRTLTRKDPFEDLTLVRKFTGARFQDRLREFQHIQHPGIASPLEVFRLQKRVKDSFQEVFQEVYYVVFEYMAYSLHYVAGNPRLDEIRLSAIVAPVLNALIYLSSLEGLEHGPFTCPTHGLLSCSNILIHPCGDVKFKHPLLSNYSSASQRAVSQECCKLRPQNGPESRYIRALGLIVMELMQGYHKEDGAIGVEDLHRWPSDCNAVSFLSATVTASSLVELSKHPLLRLPWWKGKLQGLVSFVTVGTSIGCRHPPQ